MSQSRAAHCAVDFRRGSPIAFAVIRATRTGNDLRYFWVALASLLGALATVAVGRASVCTPAEF